MSNVQDATKSRQFSVTLKESLSALDVQQSCVNQPAVEQNWQKVRYLFLWNRLVSCRFVNFSAKNMFWMMTDFDKILRKWLSSLLSLLIPLDWLLGIIWFSNSVIEHCMGVLKNMKEIGHNWNWFKMVDFFQKIFSWVSYWNVGSGFWII